MKHYLISRGKTGHIFFGLLSWCLHSRSGTFSHELILKALNWLTSNYKGIMFTSMSGLQTISPLSKFKLPPWSLSARPSSLTSSTLLTNLAAICSNGNMWHNPTLEYFALGKERDLGGFFLFLSFIESHFLAHSLWLDLAFALVWNDRLLWVCQFEWMHEFILRYVNCQPVWFPSNGDILGTIILWYLGS